MPDPFDTSFIDAETLAVQREHRLRLEMLCRGDQPETVPAFSAVAPRMPLSGPFKADAWLAGALADLRKNAAAFRDRVTYRPFALSLARYDLHFPAAVAGCPTQQESGQVWCTPLWKLGMKIAEFRAPDLDANQQFQEMLDLLRFVVEATEGRVPVEIPYVSEPLILAVELFGEDFLVLLALDPELADQFVDKLSAFILDMRCRFCEAVPGAPLMPHGSCHRAMPEGYNMLYECTTQLVSGDAYERHFLQRDRALMRCAARGAGIHLCGRHTQHCDAWREAPELKMIQLNHRATEDLETYWRNLRPDQYIMLNPCEQMTVEDALRLTGGWQLIIESQIDAPIPVRPGGKS